MAHTIQIDDTNSNAKALLEYLKTLDFVKLTDNSDWYDELNEVNIHSIQIGLDDLRNNQSCSFRFRSKKFHSTTNFKSR